MRKKLFVYLLCAISTLTVYGAELKQRVLDLGVDKILFATRGYVKGDGHWYANFGYYATSPDDKTYGRGMTGQLSMISLNTGELSHLILDKTGAVRDPQLSYDGKKVLFSYRKGGTEHFHLYTIHVDGTNLTRLTDGGYDDIEPTYMPGGGIMFISSRSQRWVNCWFSQVGNLHRCNEDGSGIELISPNIEHDNAPWPLPDGRMIYTRWEYVDRAQGKYHHLWTTKPDGTEQMVYFGNMHPGNLYIDAKPIPGSDRVVCIEAPEHGRQEHGGSVVTITEALGPDDKSAVKPIAFVPPKSGGDRHRGLYRDPFPLSEDCFIVSLDNQLIAMDGEGKSEVLYELPQKREFINEPRPVMARKRERIRPDLTDPTKETGTLILTDAYFGRNMAGIKPGSIKNLLVLETLPKPVNFTGSMEPVSFGGTYTLERILGKIPVEADGSAHMKLPAKRSLFFIALDEKDQAVKRMQSFLTVMPGEVTSCIGCHEERTQAPQNAALQLQALKRPPSQLLPVTEVPDLYDYPNEIQPILDTHCVSCHNPQTPKGGVQLTGDLGPMYSHSYFWLSALSQFGDNRNRAKSNYPPYALGDAASELMKKIRNGHGNVTMSDTEVKTIQYWLHVGAPYVGSYAALNTGMIGQDSMNHKINREDLGLPSVQAYQEVLERRCATCHESVKAAPNPDTTQWALKTIKMAHAKAKRPLPNSASDVIMNAEAIQYNSPLIPYLRHAVFNLTRPECSTLLMAPLVKDAGGWATAAKTTHPVVFKDATDPDYQSMLTMIKETAKLLHTRHKRWYMNGFQPHPAYIREMKRYGILSSDFDAATESINPYETDDTYFRQQRYKPRK